MNACGSWSWREAADRGSLGFGEPRGRQPRGRQPWGGLSRGFGDVEERLRELSARGDPAERLVATVDFERVRTDFGARPAEPIARARRRPALPSPASVTRRTSRSTVATASFGAARSVESTAGCRRADQCRSGRPGRPPHQVVRARVEHPFAHQKGPTALVIRTIGLTRARATVTLANMAGNMRRWCWLDRQNVPD